MSRYRPVLLLFLAVTVVCLFRPPATGIAAEPQVGARERCPVCGMFVAKYPNWITQVETNEKNFFFDGVKDMMAFLFDPATYGGVTPEEAKAIRVRDYYTLEWIDGRTAWYVVGSDVYGPMGHELIPFTSREAAENFRKDHHGRQVLQFKEITPELVDSLRHGMRMR